ncbi:MAG: hypothetical protein Q8L08_02520 [Candidatus Nanopelagicaceae bacterium]|nr:hypothetical protein [Candidatus Nanopelagicaceae bacterium]
MKNGKFGVLILSLLLAVVIIVGWLVGIAPQLADASSANVNRANVLAQNAANEANLRKLKTDYIRIDQIRKELSILRVAVPSSGEISTFVTELNYLANVHKVTVRSITVNDAKPYAPVVPTAGSDTSGAIPPPTTNPRITSSNFVVIPVQFSVTGDYSKVLDFVHEVQVGPRLFLISNLSSMGATDAKAVTGGGISGPNPFQKVDATVGGYVYVLLDRQK